MPVSCTREFTQMMECTAEEFIEAETREPLCTVVPEDREDTAYLLEKGIARNGQNHVTVRKRTMKGNIIWVDLHYSIFTSRGVQYAYCNYYDVTQIKENEQRIDIHAIIYVERDSQKGISIGHQGVALKKVGLESRKALEKFFGKHVNLETFVKVDKDWRNNQKELNSFGYNPE